MGKAVYLDYNATAPLRPEAADAAASALGVIGNPSSVHGFGRRARRLVEAARAEVAELVGASPGEIVFTSGGTEANNQALRGSGREEVLASAVEHPSVLQARAGIRSIPVDGAGRIRVAALEALLAEASGPALVSIMLANNETGVIQPVAEAAALAHRAGALVHCDAVQAAGRVALDMTALGVDLLSLSAHKIGGPPGVGALVVADGIEIAPLLRGGGQERRRRAGSENLAGIAGFGAAARAARGEIAAAGAQAALRDRIEHRLTSEVPGARIFGAEAARLPNTSCFALPGQSAERLVIALDLMGIAVSAGAACSSGKVAPSHVLAAMGVAPDLAGAAIRVSLGRQSTAADVERLLAAIGALRGESSAAVAAEVAVRP